MNLSGLWVTVLAVAFLLSGCANPFVAVKPNPTSGQFQTPTELSSDENSIFTPIDNLEEQRFNVLLATINVSWEWARNYGPYIKEMLENCGLTKFVGKTHLENFVIANDLGAKIPSLDNRIGYNQLSKYTGPFLIVAADFDYLGHDHYQFSITVYDPVSSSTIFHASRKAVNWLGIEEPILLPVFNSLKKWVDESKKLAKQPILKRIDA